MNWSISSTELLISLVAIALLLILFIKWFRNYLVRKAHYRITYSPNWESPPGASFCSIPDYSVGAELFKWRGILLLLSFILMCTIVGLAFFWTIPKTLIAIDCYEEEDIVELRSIPLSFAILPPPSPPPPIIDVWATDSILEEEWMPEPKKPKFLSPAKQEDEMVDTIEVEHHDTLESPPPPPPLPPSPPKPKEVTCFIAKAESNPRFPGCEDIEGKLVEKERCSTLKLLEFIYKNITYPPIARNYSIEGTVVIQFTITKEGLVSDPEILRDIGADCGKRALEAVNAMIEQGIRWIPGKQRGRNVPVKYYLPVRYKLE